MNYREYLVVAPNPSLPDGLADDDWRYVLQEVYFTMVNIFNGCQASWALQGLPEPIGTWKVARKAYECRGDHWMPDVGPFILGDIIANLGVNVRIQELSFH